MCETSYYICRHCGNIVRMIYSSGVPIVCCGEDMQELVAGSVDASVEKHVPAVTVSGDTLEVNVGSVDHPMTEEHYIPWVSVKTATGVLQKCLKPGDKPHVTFALGGEKAEAVFAYCNLHGLWKADL